MKLCALCQRPNTGDAPYCTGCGRKFSATPSPVVVRKPAEPRRMTPHMKALLCAVLPLSLLSFVAVILNQHTAARFGTEEQRITPDRSPINRTDRERLVGAWRSQIGELTLTDFYFDNASGSTHIVSPSRGTSADVDYNWDITNDVLRRHILNTTGIGAAVTEETKSIRFLDDDHVVVQEQDAYPYEITRVSR